jgi:hypothetical protein
MGEKGNNGRKITIADYVVGKRNAGLLGILIGVLGIFF